ncbi:MAG: hypothetical protein EXR85_02295 [Xanthomonadales bacterium]|nr:hypothetical protein [Xanthomonadales bacterium]
MAQKPHKPTDDLREQVESASGLGLPHDQVCALIGISDETLRKYYGPELGMGKAKASAQVAKSLFNKAVQQGDTTAMIWWTKAQMRWAETQRHENSGPDGGPQELVVRWADEK